MKKILLLAMVLYSVLAPLTYHPDTKLTLYYATLGNEKVWDIYSFLQQNRNDAPDFHYPPMNYWLLKAELPIAKMVGGSGLTSWLAVSGNEAFLSEKIFIYNLAVKTPLLILVLLAGVVIRKILLKNGKSLQLANRGMIIWLFNPITLYSAVVMGQNDILAIFPFLLGMLYLYDKPLVAFMLFGLGASVKSYPLIWALILAYSYPKVGYVKKIVFALIAVVVYYLPMLPYIRLDYFRQSVIYSGLSVRIFDSAVGIGFGDSLLIVPLLLTCLMLIGAKKKMVNNISSLSLLLMTSTLLILGFTHFHPQWFIWIAPFLSMYMVDKRDWWWVWLLTGSLLGIILLFNDKYLYWGLLSPVSPGLVNLPFISELLKVKNVDTGLLNNLSHSVIAGISLYWLAICSSYED